MKHVEKKSSGFWWRIPALLTLLWLFLCTVNGVGAAFKTLKPFVADNFETFASGGAVAGLLVGMLATCIVQSSSTVTTLIVGLVGSGTLTVTQAIPLIMGANIGTTITNTIVSLGSISRRDEFRRAFAAANIHDVFNLMAVVILLPLECMFGCVETSAHWIASKLEAGSTVAMPKGIKKHFKSVINEVKGWLDNMFDFSDYGMSLALLTVSFVVLCVVLMLIVRVMKGPVLAHAEIFFDKFIGRSALLAILFGAILTALVQSSSISTSLMVPLAGAGAISMRALFPVTLGCNIGTTITALLAALGTVSDNPELFQAGLTIAICHTLFNIYGILIVYVPLPMRNLTLKLSDMLAKQVSEKRWFAPTYVLLVFFGIPTIYLLFRFYFFGN